MSKNLIIHPADRSTDFLKPIYENISDAIILNGGATKDQVKELMVQHDRIIMLGHGSPFGLFSVGQFVGNNGYIVDSTMVPLLYEKECIFIWCNSDAFVRNNNLTGLHSGMFISEIGEATYCGLPGMSQDTVDQSNNYFAELMGEVINEELDKIHNHIIENYGLLAEGNPVANYNWNRIYLKN
jgi:hypothetical protein